MSLKSFFAKIFNWLHKVVKAADKAIDQAGPEIQKALEVGSRIVNVINTNFELAPEAVAAMIQKVLPHLSEDEIRKALKIAIEGLNIGNDLADSENLADLIEAIQLNLSKIKGFNGSRWAQTSAFIAKLIAKAFAPEGTKVSIFELLMETFYQMRVKV